MYTRAVRFAAFVSDTIDNQDDGGGGGERLIAVGEEISELEERLQELKAEQQELSELQELSVTAVTVSGLASNHKCDEPDAGGHVQADWSGGRGTGAV